MILEEEFWKKHTAGAPTGGPAQITISFYRNPQNLTVQQWMEARGYTPQGPTTTYQYQKRNRSAIFRIT